MNRIVERDTINWENVQDEAVSLLRQLIRFDTTNPPGNELPAAQWLAGVLKREGLEPTILESRPGRANLVARVKGDGAAAPLLLFSHLDVVAAEAEHWTHPPFAADLADGCVWGRGALDMKAATITELMALLLLRRQGRVLKRDLIFAAVADEETGGDWGAAWLVQNHPDLLRGEIAVNEMGGFNLDLGGRRVYTIGVAEKGMCWMKMRAVGDPGHGSMPHRHNAVVHLATAVSKLGQTEMPMHVTPPVRDFILGIARALPAVQGRVFRQLLNPRLSARVIGSLIRDERTGRAMAAMLRNTVTPTRLRAGEKINVIPSTAEAELDGRLLPGQRPEDLIREIRAVVGPGVQIEIVRADPMPPVAPFPGGAFAQMAEAIRQHDPTGIVVPYLMPAVSDSRHLAKLGIHCYGFTPLRVPPGFPVARLAHGHDERVPVDGLGWGIRVLYDFLQGM